MFGMRSGSGLFLVSGKKMKNTTEHIRSADVNKMYGKNAILLPVVSAPCSLTYFNKFINICFSRDIPSGSVLK